MQSSGSTVVKIQAEIKANGTVVASMDVYEDFYYYSSGVYTVSGSRASFLFYNFLLVILAKKKNLENSN
jgi:hypothetical protein